MIKNITQSLNEELEKLRKERSKVYSLVEDLNEQITDVEKRIRESRMSYIVEHIDVLLPLVEHNGRCSDKNLAVEGCPRCFLLYARETKYFDEKYDIEIILEEKEE